MRTRLRLGLRLRASNDRLESAQVGARPLCPVLILSWGAHIELMVKVGKRSRQRREMEKANLGKYIPRA